MFKSPASIREWFQDFNKKSPGVKSVYWDAACIFLMYNAIKIWLTLKADYKYAGR